MDEGAGGDPPSNRGSGSARPLLIASSSHLRSPLVRSPLSRSPQARVGRTVLGTGKKGAATHPATARVAEARPAATRAADVGAATTGAGQGVAGQVEEGAGQGVNGGGRGHLRARTVLPSLPSRTTYKVGDDSEDVEDSENEEEVHEDLPRYEQNQAPYVEYDHDDPLMEVGSTYPSMKVFRLAMSQHAIKHEFEYNIAKSGPKRFRAYCSRKVFDNCPWWIYATTTEDGCTVKVRKNPCGHDCSSTRRKKKVKNATKYWICEKVKDFLIDDATLGAKALQKKLKEHHKVHIHYKRVYMGKELALRELYSDWDNSFDNLYRFEAHVESCCPSSLVIIDHHSINGKIRFRRFFLALHRGISQWM